MGHQFSRAIVAAAVTVALVGCADSGGDADPPPVLENAREQVAEASGVDGAVAGSDVDDPAAPGDDAPAELPTPDPSTYVGANRVVNLWVGADGDTGPIDVWGRRTFTNGPILLAANVAFAEASAYFAAPADHDLVVVGAGAGPDGEERATMLNAAFGEQITLVFTNGDDRGDVNAPNVFERGTERAPIPPADGAGLVRLLAPNVSAFSESMISTLGGDAFYVGDSTTECRVQRLEADGFPPNILGGTHTVELELAPGPASISLHPWFSPDECDQPAVLDLTVIVGADETTLVLVFTRDGVSLEALVLPVPTIS